jgi:hypothetical protein
VERWWEGSAGDVDAVALWILLVLVFFLFFRKWRWTYSRAARVDE